ncbi:hypothetical protein M3Y99_01047200 [Aphelenchoides fujianensis]|nr:hypothetical protein M3Y99_01047200 [Aphelenchoides fujianensis]
MTQARQNVEAKENETLTLTCPVNNAANVRIEWMQNQQPIVVSPSIQISENGHKLHFINVQKSHRGLISCTAENEAGGSEAIFDVLVQVAPTIQLPAVGQRQVAVMRNHTLALQCQADGVPPPELTWSFDGVPFAAQHGSSFIPLGNTDAQLELTAGGAAEFRIANVSRKQQGRYSCSAANKVGRAEATVVVQVIEPLKLRTPSEFVRVIQGQELSVRCEVESGMRPLSAEWQKGNQTFVSLVEESGEQLAFYLHVREAQPADAGTYVCLVKSSAGQAQLPIRVEVLVPPKIEAGERVLKVVEGSQLTLDCRASGAPDPEVTWHFGSRLLSADNQGHFVIKRANVSQSGVYRCEATNAAATVSADFHVEVLVKPRIRTYEKVTKRADGGDWSCLVSNAAGTAEAPFVVLVNTAPHIDELIDQNPRIIEGNSVLLVCPVLGDPAPTVQWRHDGKPLELSADGRFKAEGTNLRIENAQASDSGRLTCAAENDIGGLETDYELEVMAAPRFLSAGQRNFVAIEGQPISIECPAEASPQPTIEWFRGTIQMSSDLSIQISPNAKKLKILNTTLEHAGKLICRATNVAGSTEIELTLRVIVPPRIDESNLITSPLAVLNRSIYLECPVRAIPPPSIHWLKDGKPVEAADLSDPQNAKFSLQQANQTFGIRRVDHSDRGVFTCVVENEGGSVSQDFTVEVLIPPVMEKQEPEEIVKREGDTLMLSCPVKNTLEKSQGTPDLTVSWTQDGRPLDANSESVEISPDGKHLKLKNIRVANAGQFKCVAANRAGQTHAKFNVNVLCTHLQTEFCRQLEFRHITAQRVAYERRRAAYERRAAVDVAESSEWNAVDEFNHSRRLTPHFSPALRRLRGRFAADGKGYRVSPDAPAGSVQQDFSGREDFSGLLADYRRRHKHRRHPPQLHEVIEKEEEEMSEEETEVFDHNLRDALPDVPPRATADPSDRVFVSTIGERAELRRDDENSIQFEAEEPAESPYRRPRLPHRSAWSRPTGGFGSSMSGPLDLETLGEADEEGEFGAIDHMNAPLVPEQFDGNEEKRTVEEVHVIEVVDERAGGERPIKTNKEDAGSHWPRPPPALVARTSFRCPTSRGTIERVWRFAKLHVRSNETTTKKPLVITIRPPETSGSRSKPAANGVLMPPLRFAKPKRRSGSFVARTADGVLFRPLRIPKPKSGCKTRRLTA